VLPAARNTPLNRGLPETEWSIAKSVREVRPAPALSDAFCLKGRAIRCLQQFLIENDLNSFHSATLLHSMFHTPEKDAVARPRSGVQLEFEHR
jgi:hypothetical protein